MPRAERLTLGPGSIHVGLWRTKAGARWWACAAPYDARLVDALKRIPGRDRAYLPMCQVWLVQPALEHTLRATLSRLFLPATMCQTCWQGLHCADLAKRAASQDACHLSSRKPEPSPPWASPVWAPPRTAAEAAAVLALAADASVAEIRAAARRAAFEAHPDRGGSTERVLVVLAARDLLLRARSATLGS